MKRLTAVVAVLIALGAYAVTGGAKSFAVGKSTLSARVLELDSESISAKGNASLVTSPSGTALEIGKMRLESMTAQTISVNLKTDKARKLTMRDASATGGVVIRAKRADKDTDDAGKPVRVIRDVYAAAQTATMPESQDVVKLEGNVVVKITEPGVADPIAVVTGDLVTISLVDGKIRIEGQDNKPAEFVVTPKDGEKK